MSPKHPAPHPGKVLRSRHLDPLGLSAAQVAEALGVSRKHVSMILRGQASVTPDMALRLGAALGTKAEVWVELQAAFDLHQALETVRRAPRPKVRRLTRHTP